MKLIIVLGMHRSGTSVLAKAVNILGVDMGQKLLGATRHNEKGHFEDKDVLKLNESFLKAMNSSWDSLTLGKGLEAVPRDEARTAIRDVLDPIDSGTSIRGIKEPRTTKLLPIWMRALNELDVEAKLLLANRHPLEVSQSLSRRDGLTEAHGLALWASYQASALQEVCRHGGLVISYPRLLDNPIRELGKIGDFLEIELPSRKAQEDFKLDFLDKGLRHAEFSDDDFSLESVPASLCIPIYRHLEKLAQKPGAISPSDALVGLDLVSSYMEKSLQYLPWYEAIDQLIRLRAAESAALTSELLNTKSALGVARSRLDWIEQQRAYKLLTKFKHAFERIKF